MMNANDLSMGVTCTDVCVTIGADKLLNNVKLRAEPGTITGLIGRNGSGKTMLLRAICGLVPMSAGSITVAGQRVGIDVDFPENIGVIIETPGFLPQYNAVDNLRILAKIRNRIHDAEIKAALTQVGLSNVSKRVSKYSLGMKQRLGIAQAIMENPDILLLDEPMNGLTTRACARCANCSSPCARRARLFCWPATTRLILRSFAILFVRWMAGC